MNRQQTFLPNLHTSLKRASYQELEDMSQTFIKYHFFDWIRMGHIKVAMWLREAGNGSYTTGQISQSIAVPYRGEPWPGAVMIPKIISNLNQIGLIRVFWAQQGIKENQPFDVDTEILQRECSGSLWQDLGEVINGASYHDLEALSQLFVKTDLLGQPGFYLRVLAWAGTVDRGHITENMMKQEFSDIRKATKFLHDARNTIHALHWANRKGLLKVSWREPGQGFDLDAGPLEKFGFTIGGAR